MNGTNNNPVSEWLFLYLTLIRPELSRFVQKDRAKHFHSLYVTCRKLTGADRQSRQTESGQIIRILTKLENVSE